MFLRRAILRAVPSAHVEEAETGMEATTLIVDRKLKYDLIAMDKEMPVRASSSHPQRLTICVCACVACPSAALQIMDGYEAVRRIRQHGYHGLIVGVTANALEADRAEFMEQGVDAVIVKPVNVHRLLEIAAQFCAQASSASSASEGSGNGNGNGNGDEGRGEGDDYESKNDVNGAGVTSEHPHTIIDIPPQ